MNRKDMISTSVGGDLNVAYIRGLVSYVESKERTNVLVFRDRNNQISTVDVSKYLDIDHNYQSQFGVGMTDDGKYFFLQRWTSGLYCFERETGMLVWQCKRKKAYELVVRNKTVVCRFMDQCVDVFDIETGSISAHYPLGFDTRFLPITDDYYLVGPKRGKFIILDNNLNVMVTIPYSRMNPNMFDTFIVNSADFVEDGILISGFEYSRSAHILAVKSGKANEFCEKSRFSRIIACQLLTRGF